MNITPFDPISKSAIGESVARKLLDTPAYPLNALPKFHGAGIYAIYYAGDLGLYEGLSKVNTSYGMVWPIYVGKASPKGSRVGVIQEDDTGTALFNRIRQHLTSLKATSLRPEDFFCKFLVLDEAWINHGEAFLINRFRPVWNALVDGFGNHAPGRGRVNGARPRWDTLHPGRKWAAELPEREETVESLARMVDTHLTTSLSECQALGLSAQATLPMSS
ncbi:Eco29kI family restriction endonuclease [Pseudomonas aeruginosa]